MHLVAQALISREFFKNRFSRFIRDARKIDSLSSAIGETMQGEN